MFGQRGLPAFPSEATLKFAVQTAAPPFLCKRQCPFSSISPYKNIKGILCNILCNASTKEDARWHPAAVGRMLFNAPAGADNRIAPGNNTVPFPENLCSADLSAFAQFLAKRASVHQPDRSFPFPKSIQQSGMKSIASKPAARKAVLRLSTFCAGRVRSVWNRRRACLTRIPLMRA